MKLSSISHVFKNTLTGEVHIAKNKVMAWLHFYEEAKNDTNRNIPTMEDITPIDHDDKQ